MRISRLGTVLPSENRDLLLVATVLDREPIAYVNTDLLARPLLPLGYATRGTRRINGSQPPSSCAVRRPTPERRPVGRSVCRCS
jgi:hypothetical protein